MKRFFISRFTGAYHRPSSPPVPLRRYVAGCTLICIARCTFILIIVGATAQSQASTSNPVPSPFSRSSASSVKGSALSLKATDPLKSDHNTYQEPALPSLPSAGSVTRDPTFGTTIIRATDGADGNTGCIVEYSIWPAFNMNNTRLQAICNYDGRGVTVFYNFDPATGKLRNQQKYQTTAPDGNLMQSNDLFWSGKSPDVIFGHTSGGKLWAYNVASNSYTLLKDFSSLLPAGTDLDQVTRSIDDNVFAMAVQDASGTYQGYLAWRRSDNKILFRSTEPQDARQAHIDKSGRYLVLLPGNQAPDPKFIQVWDLQTHQVTKLFHDSSDSTFVHQDVGHGILFSDGVKDKTGDDKNYGFHLLNNPKQVIPSLHFANWAQDAHFSMLADNENWGLVSAYRQDGGPVAGPFENEIFQVSRDGKVRRIAHHRSVFKDYYDAPMANISRDGRFIAFTSNWGGSGRRDLYIAVIPPAPVGVPGSKGGTTVTPPKPATPVKVTPKPGQPARPVPVTAPVKKLTVTVGPDRVVKPGQTVSLQARTSAPAVTYTWKQVFGPAVTLSGGKSSVALFRAPQTASVLVFQVSVTDSHRQMAQALVFILVQQGNAVPFQ